MAKALRGLAPLLLLLLSIGVVFAADTGVYSGCTLTGRGLQPGFVFWRSGVGVLALAKLDLAKLSDELDASFAHQCGRARSSFANPLVRPVSLCLLPFAGRGSSRRLQQGNKGVRGALTACLHIGSFACPSVNFWAPGALDAGLLSGNTTLSRAMALSGSGLLCILARVFLFSIRAGSSKLLELVRRGCPARSFSSISMQHADIDCPGDDWYPEFRCCRSTNACPNKNCGAVGLSNSPRNCNKDGCGDLVCQTIGPCAASGQRNNPNFCLGVAQCRDGSQSCEGYGKYCIAEDAGQLMDHTRAGAAGDMSRWCMPGVRGVPAQRGTWAQQEQHTEHGRGSSRALHSCRS